MKKVLVVDDNDDIRTIMKLRLTRLKLGLEVHDHERGIDALVDVLCSMREGCPYDAIILDCSMPHFDAFVTAQMIRLAESTGFVKVRSWIIAYTATDMGVMLKSTDLIVKSGIDGYFIKSSDEDAMILAITNWVKEKECADEPNGSAMG